MSQARGRSSSGGDRAARKGKGTHCTAYTTGGQPCKRAAVPGLTVCTSHGGGTAASVKASKRSRVSQRASALWGISQDTSGVSVKDELERLARNKLADVLALRLKLGEESDEHIGLLMDSREITDYDIEGTVQSKEGQQVRRSRKSGTSPWVQELHKAEAELMQILRLLHDVSDGSDPLDSKRIRLQTAREAARLLKAFPGISVDEVAAEVSKRG